jgi:hypothetical protein
MKKIILIFLLILVLMLASLALYLNLKKKPTPASLPIKEEIKLEKKEEKREIDPIERIKSDLIVKARFFIERYGTWSNQSNFENFYDLFPYMTEELKEKTLKKIQDLSLKDKKKFYGITTNLLSINFKNFEVDKKAEIFAEIQQREEKDKEVKLINKKINLIFIKTENDWKVASIENM